jgi:hypothetical protein
MRLLHPKRPAALGLDFGRVIMSPKPEVGGADSRFLLLPEGDALDIPPPPGAFEVIAELVRHFGGRVWIVSKAGPRIQSLTRRWLERHRFFERTGMPPRALHFVRERRDKRLEAEKLGLTHFVDDRVDVLAVLASVPNRYLFGPQGDVPAWAIHVADWAAVRSALLGPTSSGR